MERNQTWNVMSGCTLLERMKRILSKGGEQVWTGRTVLLHRAVRLVCGEGFCRCVSDGTIALAIYREKLPEIIPYSAVHPD